MGQSGSDYWHLDDVSILDENMSNSEMLVNGGFENGTLTGWQLLCISNCLSSSGAISNSPCNTGLFCYQDGCKNEFDFLRQSFSMTIGHTYTLSFYLLSDTHPNDQAFVRIF
jgi:hypothetical protein